MEGTPITLNSIETFIGDAIGYFFTIAALAVVAGLVYAGFLMVTSGADGKRFEQGKKMIWQVIIGGAVVFGVGIIARTVADFAQNPTQILR